jgi:signal transduction histidine kinase
MVECVSVFLAGWAITWLIAFAGLGFRIAPVLLATGWISLRSGRVGAWVALSVTILVTLPMTRGWEELNQFATHVDLLALLIVGHLLGSYADASAAFRMEIAQRDRLLYQADRLKSLRAMSAAVIHEIGQPLSIVSIEANHLRELVTANNLNREEMARTSALMRGKLESVIDLIRRLRHFGQLSSEPTQEVSVDRLISDAVGLARLHAAEGVEFQVEPAGSEISLWGHPVELQQALLNIIRNAAERAANGRVSISASRQGEQVRIAVENAREPDGAERAGMRIGLLVAKSIVEAAGGRITWLLNEPLVRVEVYLPRSQHD